MAQFSLASGQWQLAFERPVDPGKFKITDLIHNGRQPTDDDMLPPQARLTLSFDKRYKKELLEDLAGRVHSGLRVDNRGRDEDPTTITTTNPDEIRALLGYAARKAATNPGFRIHTDMDESLLQAKPEFLFTEMNASPALEPLVAAAGVTQRVISLLVKNERTPLPDETLEILRECSRNARTEGASL